MPPLSKILRASVTPLASILGSGLLIIVPVLERTLGALSVLGVAAVCAVAWVVGTSVRHCVRVVEPALESGSLDRFSVRLDRAGDAVIVVAYIISVALYLRIMAEYVVGYADPSGSVLWERSLASATVVLIMVVGITRGFAGLDLLDRFSLGAVLLLTTVLGGTLLFHDVGGMVGSGLDLPPVPDVGIGQTLMVLGGIVITVQGFETVRYLGDQYDAQTRVWASRVAQLIATSIYVGFVAVATPVMGLGTTDGPDKTLLDITARVAPLLALPLVLSAVLSQFSAPSRTRSRPRATCAAWLVSCTAPARISSAVSPRFCWQRPLRPSRSWPSRRVPSRPTTRSKQSWRCARPRPGHTKPGTARWPW